MDQAAPDAGSQSFPYIIMSLLLVFTIVGVGSIAWGTMRTNDLLVEAKDDYAEVQALYGDILLFDEMLTMSARQAVAEGVFETRGLPARPQVGDEGQPRGRAHWTKRYYITVERLDERLENLELHLASAPELAALRDQTSNANDLLVEMEERALAARTEQQLLASRAELSGLQYQRQKKLYRDGMVAMMTEVRDRFAEDVQQNSRLASAMIPIAIAAIVLMAFIWFVALQALLRWRSALVAARHEAERTRLTLQDAVDSSQLGVFTVFPDGRCEASGRCVALFDTDAGDDIRELASGLRVEDKQRLIDDIVPEGDASGSGEVRRATVQTARGRWLELSWRPGLSGTTHAVFGLVRDITEQYQTTERLTEVNADLETQVRATAERARAREQDNSMLLRELLRSEQDERARLGQVLHDELQQYLVAARMHAAMQRDKLAEQDEPTERLQSVIEQLDQALGSARNLHRKLRQPPPSDKGLDEVIADVVARSALHVNFSSSSNDTTALRAPATWLAWRAAEELLLNAAKYSGVTQVDLTVEVSEDGTLALVVADAGEGFVFEGHRDGTGLADLQQRATAVGGSLEIESVPGEGTTVQLTIPDATVGAIRKSRRLMSDLREIDGIRSPRCRVVIADDNHGIRQLLVRLLTADGRFEIVGTAASGDVAVTVAEALAPDAVILDYSMPGLNGDAVTRSLRAALPDVRIVGFSALPDEAEPAMREAGAVAVVGKDEEPRVLLAALLGQQPAAA